MITEVDIAAEGREFLASHGLDVAQEVSLDRAIRRDHPIIGDARADLTGKSDEEFVIAECKRDLSFDLLDQAEKWIGYANRVWLVVPHVRPSGSRLMALRVARDFLGFGVAEVGDGGVVVLAAPRWRASFDDALLRSIRPEHRDFTPAGASGGAHFSAYHGTEAALAAFVATKEGCTLEEAVDGIKHHYRSRASALLELRKRIKKKSIPGVFTGLKQRLYSSAEATGRRL